MDLGVNGGLVHMALQMNRLLRRESIGRITLEVLHGRIVVGYLVQESCENGSKLHNI